jgi:hypothetical protein
MTSETTKRNFLDRYEEGGMAIIGCVSGIIVSIISFITFTGRWVVFDVPYGGTYGSTLLEFSDITKSIAGVTKFFASDATTVYSVMSLISKLSFWVLLIGAIIMLIAAIAVLISPKVEVLGFICIWISVMALAVIGLIFTAAPLVLGEYFSFTPIPLVMLIFAGIPAAVMKFLV